MTTAMIIPLTGELTGAVAEHQKVQLLDQIGPDVLYLELDLAGVNAIDARGVQVLVDLYKEMKNRSGRLSLVQVPENVRHFLEQNRLDAILPIEGITAGERDRVDPTIQRPIPTGRPLACQAARSAVPRPNRLPWLLGTIGVLVAVVALEQILLNRPGLPPLTEADRARFALGNARMVGALLLEHMRQKHRCPSSPEEVQVLVHQRNLSLVNLFSNQPLRVVLEGDKSPGDLEYRVFHGHFYLRILDQEGQPLRGPDGKELVISNTTWPR